MMMKMMVRALMMMIVLLQFIKTTKQDDIKQHLYTVNTTSTAPWLSPCRGTFASAELVGYETGD